MSNFNTKVILSSRTLGDKLKRAREEEQISLEDVAKKIKINQSYLEYLEQGQYNKMPSPVYIKNYLKKYCSFLQLSWPTVEKMYEREMIIYQSQKPKQMTSKFNQKALVIPKLISAVLIVLVVAALGVYLVFEVGNFIQPPKLIINNIPDQQTITEHTVIIDGETSVDAQIYINGQEIITDEKGHFYEVVALQPGLNTIKLSAKKKHSKERVIYKQIVVEE